MAQFDRILGSPLFRTASRDIRDTLKREFQTSDFGRLVNEAKKASRSITTSGNTLAGVAQSMKYRFDPERALSQLMGADIGRLARDVQKYSRGGGPFGRFVQGFLASLGPAGQLLQALADPRGKSVAGSLTSAKNLLRAFGWEPLPGTTGVTPSDINRGVVAARSFLERLGYTILPPGGEPSPQGRGRLPFGLTGLTKSGRDAKTVRLPVNDDLTAYGRFDRRHPIVTGEFVSNFDSDNVQSYGYDIENRYLYVRFWAKDNEGKRNGPGALYRYSTVEPKLFLSLYSSPRKGEWVWDHLRERGTVSGHQKPYELVGITNGYVPRRATLKAHGPQGMGEYFETRTVHVGGGRWLKSQKPTVLVQALAKVNRGEPNRGSGGGPNRGNGGRPRTGRG